MPPPLGHPLAIWLHRVADNLDAIFVRYRDSPDASWSSRSLATLPEDVAAWHVADFLRRWPFIPVRIYRDAPDSNAALRPEELRQAMHRERTLVGEFSEIRERILLALLEHERDERTAAAPEPDATGQVLADAAALVGYLQRLLADNERLAAFLLGLEEAGAISREELELLVGLRRA